MIDLAALPSPETIKTLAYETILGEIKADVIARRPETADVLQLESSPIVTVLEAMAERELAIRAALNDDARSLMLAFATGANLDHIGITYYNGTLRLTITQSDDTTTPPTPAVMETDNDFRLRLALQPESESVAGPRDAYRYLALSADGTIKDASVGRPEPGTTEVFILTRSGEMASASLIATVAAALSPDDKRPHCEEVIVSPATLKDYTLDIDLTIFSGPAGELVLAAANKSLQAFSDDSYALGRDIILSAIDAAAHQSGVKKVVINQPVSDISCGTGEAPRCTGINIRISGVE